MLLENTGRILCDPRDTNLTGKIIGKDVTDAGFVALFKAKDGLVKTMINGREVRADVRTTPRGWKILIIQAEDEIFAATNAAIRNCLFISLGVALVMWWNFCARRP